MNRKKESLCKNKTKRKGGKVRSSCKHKTKVKTINKKRGSSPNKDEWNE